MFLKNDKSQLKLQFPFMIPRQAMQPKQKWDNILGPMPVHDIYSHFMISEVILVAS